MVNGNYIDFHAHHPSLAGERVVQDGVDTRGRHPWHPESVAPCPPIPDHILAIGESGLDRLCHTPYDLQLRVFREETALSETLQKPLILHCVRAIDDVLRIRRELHARQFIVWHGYRGGEQQLLQLVPHGFFFSFGSSFRAEALRACPLDRLLLETDEDTRHPITQLYESASTLRNIPLQDLTKQMQQNFQTLFELNRH